MRPSTKKVAPSSKVFWNLSHVNMLYNIVSMALSVTYIAVTQSISSLYTLITNIQTNLTNVETLRNITRNPITGYAAQKKAIRIAMEAMGTAIMNSAYAYAAASNNDVLKAQTINAASRMSKKSYRECLEIVYAAIGAINPFVTDGSLTDYNVTTGMMTVWTSLADQLTTLMTSPQNAIATRTATNDNIQTLLLECMVLLTNSGDTVVSQLRDTNATYYNAWWSSRRLHEHHLSTRLHATVKDASGNPVTEGQVFIVGTELSGNLDSNGSCNIDHMPFGSYQVAITTPVGEGKFGPYVFKKGRSKTIHFKVGVHQEAPAKTTASSTDAPSKTPITNINVN